MHHSIINSYYKPLESNVSIDSCFANKSCLAFDPGTVVVLMIKIRACALATLFNFKKRKSFESVVVIIKMASVGNYMCFPVSVIGPCKHSAKITCILQVVPSRS
ncbi:hypothetical protein BT93_L3367 [Corymbia citriodora subsp. variegata]|uniref:Uncharacterized protein n=1 Tax=Corymbia citriodora subsp. variegata TaxID=360336 RepID=A0A8T0CHN1_CORYI|nr:hypothetical protein BT93_L3367 [Corymbia citriodora subsp. variegata]